MAVFTVFMVSLIINAFISSLIGLAGLFLGHNFFIGFLLSLGIIYITGPLFNTWSEKKLRNETRKIKMLEELQRISATAELTCAYCNVRNKVPLLLNQDNDFKCLKCENRNRVQINLATIRITEPKYAKDPLHAIFEQLGAEN